MSKPSVGVVVLTLPSRQHFLVDVAKQIERFSLRPHIVLVDDLQSDPGTKRQHALESLTQDIVVFLDDDDWHHPLRVEKQVAALLERPRGLVGTTQFFVQDLRNGKMLHSRTWGGADCMPAGSMAVWREAALEVGFLPGLCAELKFQRGFGERAYDMKDPSLFVHQRHGNNATPDDWVLSTLWPVAAGEIRRTLGDAWDRR